MTTKITTVTLTDILKGKKINPKMARRRLRNSDDTPKPVDGARWAWSKTDAVKVRKIVNG